MTTSAVRHRARYASVVLDVDSTLSQIEGIEWLSRRCTLDVQQRIRETTAAAMRGEIALESVYGERLQLVHPTRDDVARLSDAYIRALAPGATEVIAVLRANGIRIALVSGGIREAIVPLAEAVGLCDADVNAVSLRFDEHGTYVAYDTDSPLTRRDGKSEVVRALRLPSPMLAVGDGITDAELKQTGATFMAYVGVVHHKPVVLAADAIFSSFAQLPSLIFV